MTQRRIQDFGSTVTASKMNQINQAKSDSGILSTGAVIEVARSNTIKINPFKVLTPDGVIITEDTVTEVDIPITVSPKRYTLILRHVLSSTSGGSVAAVELLDSFFPIGYFSDATILGWIAYAGNSAPINSTMLYQPRSIRTIESSNDDIPIFQMTAPFDKKWLEIAHAPEILVSSEFDGGRAVTKLINPSTVIIHNTVKIVSIVNGERPPAVIRISAKADYQASLVVSVLDENGTEFLPANNYIVNTSWDVFEMRLPNFNGLGNFKPHTTWSLKLEIQLNPEKMLYLQSISVSDYNLPVTGTGAASITDFSFNYTFSRLPTVLARWNAITGLPVAPSQGNRFIAVGTANGWTENHIYEWTGTAWSQTVPVIGSVVRVTGENQDLAFTSLEWVNGIPAHLIFV